VISSFFILKEEEMWKTKTTQPSQHQICCQNIRHHKFLWKHLRCNVRTSEVATLSPCFTGSQPGVREPRETNALWHAQNECIV